MKAGQMVGGKPAISAHQGGREGARCGTREAYQGALETGAEYIEFDVRRTRDGQLVAYHGRRAPWARARLSHGRLCELAGYRVPLAAEVMTLIAGRARGHLDLKEPGCAEAVVGQAVDILGREGFVVSTEDEKVAALIRRGFPGVAVALTVGGDAAEAARHAWRWARSPGIPRVDRVLACGADWAALYHLIARRGVLAQCRRSGIKTMVWTVSTDRALRRWLARPGVDLLVTDRPGRAVALRRALAGAR